MQGLFSNMRFGRLVLLLMAAIAAPAATTWDNSGNSKLTGTYYFRQVYYIVGDQYGDLSRAIAAYGMIKFDGNGNYSITAAEGAKFLDSGAGAGNLITSGTYSIAASGFGFISSPYATGDVVYGLVSASGIFIGSSTETANGYNDMFVAAPLASPVPAASSWTGSWTCADLDLAGQGGSPTYALSLMFSLSPDGAGNLGTSSVTGYYGGSATALTPQVSTGLKYIFSNGAAVATFPSNGALVYGQKYLYFSKDGNFLFGGAPNGYDMIVGVKTGGTALNTNALYYQAGIDETGGDLDTYYGSFSATAGAAPPCATPLASACQTILGHQRVNDVFTANSYDYTDSDQFTPLTNGTFNNGLARYVVGTGGTVRIGSGVSPYLGLSVAVQAPTLSGTGVFLDPTRIQNSASSAPFTAGIAPGELLTLYGSNLAAAVTVAGIPFPTTLGAVQVSIGGLPAAIYYVSPTQISAIVPYGVTGPIAQIQVTNNGTLSNAVTTYVSVTAPGIFTQNQNGTGYGSIEHLDGTVVTAANPAQIGETLSVYLTGLGAVSPTIADGAPGPSSILSNATATISVDFSGIAAATPSFAGLAPGFSGLYQMNVTVPAGLTVGDNFLDISGPDSYMNYKLIPIVAAASTPQVVDTRATAALAAPQAAPRLRKPGAGKLRTGGGR
jgi:uncharacterized protein (TIGR03437 family)